MIEQKKPAVAPPKPPEPPKPPAPPKAGPVATAPAKTLPTAAVSGGKTIRVHAEGSKTQLEISSMIDQGTEIDIWVKT
jgi:hypothetical protein